MDTIPGFGVYCPFQTMRCRYWLPTLALSALIVSASLVPIALAEEGSASKTVIIPAREDVVDAGTATPAPAVDAGVAAPAPATGSGSAVPSDSTTKVTTTVTVESGDTTLMKTLYDGVRSKDWFLVIGAALALIIHGARWLLVKKWPKFEEDRYGYFLAAAIAGTTALATAWLSGAGGAATAESWVGGLKLFAAAVLAYVTAKKLVAKPPADPASEDLGSLTPTKL